MSTIKDCHGVELSLNDLVEGLVGDNLGESGVVRGFTPDGAVCVQWKRHPSQYDYVRGMHIQSLETEVV